MCSSWTLARSMPVICAKAGSNKNPASVAGAPGFLPSMSLGLTIPVLVRLMIAMGERV